MIRVGAPALAVLLGVASAIDLAVQPDEVAAASLALVAVATVPWLLIPFGPRRRVPHAVVSLAALTALNVFGEALGISVVAASGPQVSLMILVLLVGQTVCTAQPRVVVGVTIAAFGLLIGRCVAAGELSDFLPWYTGLLMAMATGWAIRVAGLTVVELQSAQAVLSRHTRTEERRRMARDIHDVVAHTMAVTMLHITAARLAVSRAPDEAREALEEAERHGRASLTDIRRIVEILRLDDELPSDPEPGLEQIPELIGSYRQAGLALRDVSASETAVLAPMASSVAYRVVQEALANAVKHGCGPVDIKVAPRGRGVQIRVANMINRERPPAPQGSGLAGMRERLSAVGGHLETSTDGDEWVLEADLPSPDPR
ncbi:MAG: histidine kinase [Aquihabitans sp.]